MTDHKEASGKYRHGYIFIYVYILYVAGLLHERKFEKWSGEEVLMELGFSGIYTGSMVPL